jgi:hypothetical protein
VAEFAWAVPMEIAHCSFFKAPTGALGATKICQLLGAGGMSIQPNKGWIMKRSSLRPLKRIVVESFNKRLSPKTRFSRAKSLVQRKAKMTKNEDFLLVHTMGKVGTSTIFKSLDLALNAKRQVSRKLGAPHSTRIWHLHWITEDRLRENEEFHFDRALMCKTTHEESRFYPRDVWHGQYLSGVIQERNRNGEKVSIVTLVRDPVARDISSFFEAIELFHSPVELKRLEAVAGSADAFPILEKRFLELYVDDASGTRVDADPTSWLTEQIEKPFGIDLLGSSFETSKGWRVYESDCAEVLLLRMEDIGSCGPEALSSFLGIENIEILSRNVTAEKKYAADYQEFKNRIRLPRKYLDKMYNSRMARKFYSNSELAKFRERWLTDG